mmetsp:Transcript_520/g.1671  ORF Transcript_520/g.1671 Transcript_520/m.1671 type:complete len:209 (-) Transcript_520:967-1593(-)
MYGILQLVLQVRHRLHLWLQTINLCKNLHQVKVFCLVLRLLCIAEQHHAGNLAALRTKPRRHRANRLRANGENFVLEEKSGVHHEVVEVILCSLDLLRCFVPVTNLHAEPFDWVILLKSQPLHVVQESVAEEHERRCGHLHNMWLSVKVRGEHIYKDCSLGIVVEVSLGKQILQHVRADAVSDAFQELALYLLRVHLGHHLAELAYLH